MNTEQIKDRYTMRDMLQRYGLPQPNKAGFLCCPFHKEKTASMKLYPKDFHCFGCGAHGDIFTFVMRMEGLTFQEAFAALGGGYATNFTARLSIYRAQKRREMQQKTEERLKQKKKLNDLLLAVYRRWLGRLEPLSDGWTDTYNALQYQEYLQELLNDPKKCYEVIKRGKEPEGEHGFNHIK